MYRSICPWSEPLLCLASCDDHKKVRPRSGSSVAAAVISGLAAVVIGELMVYLNDLNVTDRGRVTQRKEILSMIRRVLFRSVPVSLHYPHRPPYVECQANDFEKMQVAIREVVSEHLASERPLDRKMERIVVSSGKFREEIDKGVDKDEGILESPHRRSVESKEKLQRKMTMKRRRD